MPTFADHNNHRTPPNQKTNFHRKLWEKHLYFRQLWEFVGFFWGPWTLNLKNHSKAFWGENPPPTDPTNRFATQLCSIWQWDRCEVASFSVHLEIGRFRHICPKLTLDQRYAPCVQKKRAKLTQSPRVTCWKVHTGTFEGVDNTNGFFSTQTLIPLNL